MSNSKKEKPTIASKVKTSKKDKKRFFNPSSIWAKRKKGRVVKQQIGPKKSEISINQQPFHLDLSITSKDGQRVSGDLVIRYTVVDVNRYFEKLNDWENSMESLQSDMAYELNAELTPYGMRYEKSKIMGDRDTLVAEVQTKMSSTFREMGIRPYKIFPVWKSFSPVIEKGLYEAVQENVKEVKEGIETQVNDVQNSYQQLEEKLTYSTQQVEDSIEKLKTLKKLEETNSEIQDVVSTLMKRVETQKEDLMDVKKVLATLSSTYERPEIADYLHEKGMNIAMSQPSVYNKGGKGPDFIEEFTKEGLNLYEKLTNPRNTFDDEILDSLAKRAYRKVIGE